MSVNQILNEITQCQIQRTKSDEEIKVALESLQQELTVRRDEVFEARVDLREAIEAGTNELSRNISNRLDDVMSKLSDIHQDVKQLQAQQQVMLNLLTHHSTDQLKPEASQARKMMLSKLKLKSSDVTLTAVMVDKEVLDKC